MAAAVERAERRVQRANDALTRTQDELAAANAARSALEEVQGFLPQAITPTIRQSLAAGTGLAIGVVNEATGLPEPIIPAAVTVVGAGFQFFTDMSPDANEATISVTEAASALLGYMLGGYATKGLMEQILGSTPRS